MKKEDVQSLVRYLLQIAGSYLVGKNLFGHAIDANLWETIGGAVLVLIMTIWGIADKSATPDQVQSGFRSVLTTVLTLLSSWGYVSGQSAVAIVSLSSTLIPILQSHTSRVQVKQLASGQLKATDTGKTAPAPPKVS